jgi:hypothetical protein
MRESGREEREERERGPHCFLVTKNVITYKLKD